MQLNWKIISNLEFETLNYDTIANCSDNNGNIILASQTDKNVPIYRYYFDLRLQSKQ